MRGQFQMGAALDPCVAAPLITPDKYRRVLQEGEPDFGGYQELSLVLQSIVS